jgi:hypothetical protein
MKTNFVIKSKSEDPKIWIYLDDIRTPGVNDDIEWHVVRTGEAFVDKVKEIGLSNINGITFDHDLGPEAMDQYFKNVRPNFSLDYDKIKETTGYDLIKWLVDHYYEINPEKVDLPHPEKKKLESIPFPKITVHSANPIGSANIMGYVNNFFKNEAKPESCIRFFWPLDPKSDQ